MVELLTDVDMANIIFLAIQKHSGSNTIATDIIDLVVQKMITKKDSIDSTQDICDTILECFDLYNAFINEKNMDLPYINDESYDLVVDVLNNIIGEMIENGN